MGVPAIKFLLFISLFSGITQTKIVKKFLETRALGEEVVIKS
jgi:hypothetical protein